MDPYVPYKEPEKKINTLYNKEYNDKTINYYKMLRIHKLNVMNISTENILYDYKKSFTYKYIWNSITGINTDNIDPYGKLYFFPDDLINYFYNRRLYKLWDNNNYGEFVGAGDTLSLNINKDLSQDYLFRLPVNDCYVLKNTHNATVTMGPKLVLKDIEKIKYLAEKYYKNNYFNTYQRKRPDLVLMYKYYNQSISKTPELSCDTDVISHDDLEEKYFKQNREYVNNLISI